MGTQQPPASELEQQLEQQEQEVKDQIEQAAASAGAEAQAQGLSEAEVAQRVEAARKEEKDKLYPQLKALKDSLKEIQDVLRSEKDEKKKIQQEKDAEAESQRLATLSSEERQAEALARIEEQLRKEREARLESERKAAERERSAELREYRRQAIQAAEERDEKLLPELVRGNSEEEIDASIQIAKTRYEELAERFKAELGTRTRAGMPRPTSPGIEALEQEELDEQLREVDLVKYRNDKEYRETVQRSLGAAYARSQQ